MLQTYKHSLDKFLNLKTCEQGMQHLLIDVRGLNSYSRIKSVHVLDVPCVGDDSPVLILNLVCPWLEHHHAPSQGGDSLCLSLLP
jgi:hypothetical protein